MSNFIFFTVFGLAFLVYVGLFVLNAFNLKGSYEKDERHRDSLEIPFGWAWFVVLIISVILVAFIIIIKIWRIYEHV